MRIFICDELLQNIYKNISEIENYYCNIDVFNSKPYFIYCFSLFESALTEALRHFLHAFPEKSNGEIIKDESNKHQSYFRVTKEAFLDSLNGANSLHSSIVNDKVKSLAKGNLCSILVNVKTYFDINLDYNKELFEKISFLRNKIVHENINTDRKYVYETNEKETSPLEYKHFCDEFTQVLKSISESITAKYSKYTKKKLIEDCWNYIFDTPLLKFEKIIYIDEREKVIRFNFEHIEKVKESLCTSEKFYLAVLLQQYNTTKNDEYFKFRDMPMLVSLSGKDELIYIIKLFARYPYLFNGEKIDC